MLDMLGTFNDWMLGLPVIPQLLVAFAAIFAIGATPLLMWVAFVWLSTPDASHDSQGRPRS